MFDEPDVIETPENVNLERDLAGIGSRFVALLVDYLMVFLILLVLNIFHRALAGTWPMDITRPDAMSMSTVVYAILSFLVLWGYFIFFEASMNGQTPGKKTLKLRVVSDMGGPASLLSIVVRNLFRVLDVFIFIGPIAMMISKKWQRLGDMAAGTVVVAERRFDYSAMTRKNNTRSWEVQMNPEALMATGLTPKEFSILSNYWMRRHELTLEARSNLLRTLVLPILQSKGIEVSRYSPEIAEREVGRVLQLSRTARPTSVDRSAHEMRER